MMKLGKSFSHTKGKNYIDVVQNMRVVMLFNITVIYSHDNFIKILLYSEEFAYVKTGYTLEFL